MAASAEALKNTSGIQPGKTQRCAPCQLQLCKSRTWPPHAALKEISRNDTGGELEILYTCGTCEATLVVTSDMTRPGWRHER